MTSGNHIARAISMLWLAAMPAWAVIVTNGPATSFLVKTNAASGNRYVEFILGTNGTLEVVPFAPDVVRVRYHFVGLYDREEPAIAKPFSNWPSFSSTITNIGGTNLVIETDMLKVDIVLSNKFQVHFKDKTNYFLLRDFHIEYDPSYFQIFDGVAYSQVSWASSTSVSNFPAGFKLKAIKVMPTNEVYFGGGEFATALNRRGASLQYWNQGTFGWEENRNPMYMSLPFYYGVQPAATNHPPFAYGVFFNNPARPLIKFNSGLGDTYSFEAGDDQLDYFFFGGSASHEPKAILDRYSELTGRPTMLPKWAFGYHQSRHSYTSQSNVQEIAQSMRDNDIPCDAVYLDIDSQNNREQLTFNSGFTNVAGMISFCTNLGIRLVPLVEPCLRTNDPMFSEAFTNLYFLKQLNLNTYIGTNFLGQVSWMDYSISQTRDWWTGKLTNYFASNPFEALWNDLNEPEENAMPLNNIYFLDGRYGGGLVTNDTRKWHAVNKNTFPLLQTAVSYGAQRAQYPNRRPFVLSRSGWPGIARYAVGWSGDNVASYDQLRYNIRLGTSVMISGQPNFGHDVGGFLWDDQSDNLFTRWLAMGCLQPFFRNHTFSFPREPWLFDDENVLMNRRLIKFRYEMMPYLYSLAYESSTNGLPMNTPAVFEFMGDVNTYSLNDYEFMVGRNLMAAPVYASNATTRSVYLPFGANWFSRQYDIFYLGGQTISEPASLGTLPQFVREGTIIPMGPAMNYVTEFQPAGLDVHVWPQAPGEFTMYEDDGATTNFQAGVFARTRFASAPGVNSLAITSYVRQGSYDPGIRSFHFVVHALTNVAAVTANGAGLERVANRDELDAVTNGWCFNYPQRRLTVKILDTAAQTAVAVDFGTPNPPSTNTFTSAFTNMAAAGTFNYWNEAVRNMKLVSNGLWAVVEDLSGQTNVAFRFVANDQWAFTNWGDTAQTNQVVPINNVADPLGSNIVVSGSLTGLFSITFNETNLRYTVAAASSQDSDIDGVRDDWEFYYGLNPLDRNDAAFDADGDGLNNSNEFESGGNPIKVDSDGDGQGDQAEFVAGSQLTNAASYFGITSHQVSATNDGVVVTWLAVTSRTYEIQFLTNLLNYSDWQALNGFTNLSGSGSLSITDTNTAPGRHYRVGVRKP